MALPGRANPPGSFFLYPDMPRQLTMRIDTVSLCTYTYNDARFVHDLLARMPSWTRVPDEIILVDDGSDPPFVPKTPQSGLRILRNETNSGITPAKAKGISAARGDAILSLDCDVRLEPDYLERCLKHIKRPEVGMAAGSVVYDSGRDLVSRYMAMFGEHYNLESGPTDFIPGTAFLLRRAIWEEVGGFGGHTEVCEDHVLCSRIQAAGYILLADNTARSRQMRKLSRLTLFRRVWNWCHKSVKQNLRGGDRTAPYLFEVLVRPMLNRVETAVNADEPLFLYLELLYLAYTVLNTLQYGVDKSLIPLENAAGFEHRLAAFLASAPGLARLVRADLLRLDAPSFNAPHPRVDLWNDFFVFTTALEGPFLKWMETQGVSAILAEDSATAYDFSSYATAENRLD